jgi:hypothetical protein
VTRAWTRLAPLGRVFRLEGDDFGILPLRPGAGLEAGRCYTANSFNALYSSCAARPSCAYHGSEVWPGGLRGAWRMGSGRWQPVARVQIGEDIPRGLKPCPFKSAVWHLVRPGPERIPATGPRPRPSKTGLSPQTLGKLRLGFMLCTTFPQGLKPTLILRYFRHG